MCTQTLPERAARSSAILCGDAVRGTMRMPSLCSLESSVDRSIDICLFIYLFISMDNSMESGRLASLHISGSMEAGMTICMYRPSTHVHSFSQFISVH